MKIKTTPLIFLFVALISILTSVVTNQKIETEKTPQSVQNKLKVLKTEIESADKSIVLKKQALEMHAKGEARYTIIKSELSYYQGLRYSLYAGYCQIVRSISSKEFLSLPPQCKLYKNIWK